MPNDEQHRNGYPPPLTAVELATSTRAERKEDRYSAAAFGPAVKHAPEDPARVEERRAAGQAAYDAAIAAGRSKRAAESARQHGDGKKGREQQGLPEPDGEQEMQLALQDRLDLGWNRKPAPRDHLPPIPVCPCNWCQHEGAHAVYCSVHRVEADGACDCGLIEKGIASSPGPMKRNPFKPKPAAKSTKRPRRPW